MPTSLKALLGAPMLVLGSIAGAAPALLGATGSPKGSAVPDFHADIAPILRDYCGGCHSGADREADFSIETYASLKKGGENGAPLPRAAGEASLLQKVIHGKKPAMPPQKEPQPTSAELATLDAWLNAGAPGPKGADPSILTLVTVPDLPLKVQTSKAITAATVSLDGRSQAVARYRSIEVKDTATGKVQHRLEGLPGKVTSLQFSKDGTHLAIATGVAAISGSAQVWTLGDPTASILLEGAHHDLVYAVRWSPDERLIATGGYDSKIVIWDAQTGRMLRTLGGHNGAVFDLAFSPDGLLLASASGDQTVKIWRVLDGERLDTLKEPLGEQFAVRFTPDGKHIVAAGVDRRLRVWEVKSREKAVVNPMLESRFAHEATIHALSISPKGDRLVSTALDRSLKVWSLPALELLKDLPQQSDTLTSLSFLNTGASVLASRMDGTVEILAANTEAVSSQNLKTTASEIPTPGGTDNVAPVKLGETEPNNTLENAQAIHLPAEIQGKVDAPGDVDLFRFEAKKGEALTFAVFAEREKSTLDSRLEVLDSKGEPIERVVLQALRSSWLSFRGKDATTSADFRIQHYTEMGLNEFLYCNGEVVKLWMFPRGPDSGFLVYPGSGNRHNYFDTTPLAHPLGQPVYTVRPLPPGSIPPPNGLPVFRLYYENDDDASREGGRDSVLHFQAPADGTYHLRLGDSRGFGGDKAHYRLVCTRSTPDFSVELFAGANPAVSPGSGREFQVKAKRRDGFEGEIRVELTDLPPGFSATTPILIEAGQTFASGAIYAEKDLTKPTPEVAARTKLVATASIQGREVRHVTSGLGEIKVGAPAKVLVRVLPSKGTPPPSGQPLELVIHPGETISARIQATRVDFKDRIELGTEDSGRNLPHGVYVDNIGLSGLLILEGETEREFFLTASKVAAEGRRLIFFRTKADGTQAAPPVLLHVKAAR